MRAAQVMCLVVSLTWGSGAAARSLGDAARLADSLFESGNTDSALASLSLVVGYASDAITPQDTVLLPMIYRIGAQLESQGHHADAASVYKLAASIAAIGCGAEPDSVAGYIYRQASDYFHRSLYARSEAFCNKALSIWEKTGSPRRIDAHLLLGNVVIQFGMRTGAEAHYRQAIRIGQAYYGENHFQTARALSGLANIYFEQGNFAEAEPLYRMVLQIYLDTQGEQFSGVPGMLINIGLVLDEQGRYEQAEEHYLHALRLLAERDTPNPYGTAAALQNLAGTYKHQKRYDEATDKLKQALRIVENTLGPGNPRTMSLYEGLATLSFDRGELPLAEDYLLRAMRIADSLVGRKHFATANYLITLGKIRGAQGNLTEAKSLYEEALAIHEATFGSAVAYAAGCLESLSETDYRLGMFSDATQSAARALQVRRKLLRDFLLVDSERDALISSRAMQTSIDKFLSIYLSSAGANECREEEAVDILLSGKGEISDAIFERRQLLNLPMDSLTADLWNAYRSARYQMSQLYVYGPDSPDDSVFRSRLDSLSAVVAHREVLLAKQLDKYRQSREYDEIDHVKIASLLPENTVLIEYKRFKVTSPVNDKEGQSRYIAAVVGNDTSTTLVRLGDAAPIDDLITQYRDHFAGIAASGHLPATRDLTEYKRIAKALYDRLIAPIEDELKDKDVVFIAPDGRLNWISFAALVDHDDHYMVEGFPIHYLSSGRDLVRLETQVKPTSGLLAVGDPAFATPNPDMSRPDTLAKADGEPMSAVRSLVLRSNCAHLQDLKLNALPNTRTEIARVLDIWKAETIEPVDTLLGVDATEAHFKHDAHGKRVIHLSTHGYYLQGACSKDQTSAKPQEDEMVVTEDPLLQSGLFFAGCMDPRRDSANSGQDDNVLTAAEITGMNLNGTRLVVLSACETGLGKLYQGEGVYGLRRAFQIAGARTVISTLWPIADELTAPMLPPIYRLSQEPLPNRLRTTQLEWIKRLRDNGLADHPYSWGAFIAQGDWR